MKQIKYEDIKQGDYIYLERFSEDNTYVKYLYGLCDSLEEGFINLKNVFRFEENDTERYLKTGGFRDIIERDFKIYQITKEEFMDKFSKKIILNNL